MLVILPHEISCALCIHVFCQKIKDNDVVGEFMSKETQRKVLLTVLKVIRNPNLTWKQFLEFVRETLPQDLYQTFVKEISSIEDADQLTNLFKSMEEFTLEQNIATKLQSSSLNRINFIKRTSVLGLFLRKLIITFRKMSFDNVNKLFKAFEAYRSDTLSTTSVRTQSLSPIETSMDLSCADESTASMSSMTLEDSKVDEEEKDKTMDESTLEENKENVSTPSLQTDSQNNILLNKNNVLNFIAEQVELLETNIWNALEPQVLQEKIEQIQRFHADVVDVYYLGFLNYLRMSEVNKAKKLLCLYFDYKVFRSASNKNDLTELEKHQAMFKRFRYCSLNLGIMHCSHGNYSESLMALEEAVRVSQETNDDQCLKHAIFWLNIVKEETGQLTDSNVQSLYKEITGNMYTEDDQVIDHLHDIDCLGVLRYSKILALKGIYLPKTLLSTISKIVVSNITISSTALLTRSSLFDFYGFKLLSIFNCQIPLQTPLPTKKSAKQCRLGITDENFVVALCQLAMHLGYFCHYEKALGILEFVKNQVPIYSPHLKVIKKTSCILKFKQFVMARELSNASKVAKFVSNSDQNEGALMAAIIDVVRGNLTDAFKKASSVRQRTATSNSLVNTMLKAKALLLSIEIKLCSLNPSQAIEDLLELIAYAREYKMLGITIEANICLIRYYIMFRLYGKALSFINSVFIDTLANGNSYCIGLLYFYQGKCLHALKKGLGQNPDVSENKFPMIPSRMGDIIPLYEKSLKYFKESNAKSRMCDVYYELAMLFNDLGREKERNAMATQYRLIHETIKEFSSCVLY